MSVQQGYQRETEFFKYHPLAFVDDLTDACKDLCADVADSLEYPYYSLNTQSHNHAITQSHNHTITQTHLTTITLQTTPHMTHSTRATHPRHVHTQRNTARHPRDHNTRPHMQYG